MAPSWTACDSVDDAVGDDVADGVRRGDRDEVVDLERLARRGSPPGTPGCSRPGGPGRPRRRSRAPRGRRARARRRRPPRPAARRAGRPRTPAARPAAPGGGRPCGGAGATPAPRPARGSGARAGRGGRARRSGAARRRPGRPAGARLGDARRARATSPRRIPAQPPAPAPGRRWYHDRRSSPIAKSGVRCPTPRRDDARRLVGPRYMRWWLLMAPTTGPSASRRNDSRPSSTTRRSGDDSSSASVSSSAWRNSPTRRARPVASWAAPARGSQRNPPVGGRSSGRSPTVSTWRRTVTPSIRAGAPARDEHRPGRDRERRARERDGLAGGRHREPRLHLLGAVDERQLAGRRGPRIDGSPLTILDPGVDRGGLGVLGVEVPVRTRDPRPGRRVGERVRPSADCSPTPGRARRARQHAIVALGRRDGDRRAGGRKGDLA